MRMLRDTVRMGVPVHQGRHRRGLFRTAGRGVLGLTGGVMGLLFMLMRVMQEPMGHQPRQPRDGIGRCQQED